MTWAATQAKAKFSEILDKAETQGPQRIDRRKKRFILLTEEQFKKHGKKSATPAKKPFVSAWDALKPSFSERYDDIDFPRLHSTPRMAKF
jgi:hypothetical protein